jgi:hypothetical protein
MKSLHQLKTKMPVKVLFEEKEENQNLLILMLNWKNIVTKKFNQRRLYNIQKQYRLRQIDRKASTISPSIR